MSGGQFTNQSSQGTVDRNCELNTVHCYLKKLLDGAEVEWIALADGEVRIAQLKRGRVMSKGYLVENAGDYPVYSSQTGNNGQIGKIKTFDFEGESITWTTDGANAGTVFHRTGKFSITNVCGIIRICDPNELRVFAARRRRQNSS